MKAAWIAVGLMVAYASGAQTPIGSGTTHEAPLARSKLTETAHNQYVPSDSPLPVTVVSSPNEAANASIRENKTDQFNADYLKSQIRLAVAAERQANAARVAAVLVILDFVVAAFALWFLRGTYLAARAQLRPKIIVRNISLEKDSDGKREILYALVNIGTSKGTIVDSWITTEAVEEGEHVRNLRALGHKQLGGPVFAVGQYYDFNFPLPDGHSKAVGSLLHDLYFTGAVRYIDEFGNSRNSVFRRKYRKGGFHRTDDPDHEYAD
jgi:hypothetical protein